MMLLNFISTVFISNWVRLSYLSAMGGKGVEKERDATLSTVAQGVR